MKNQKKVHAIEQRAEMVEKKWPPLEESYPTEVVDLIVFHKLHLSLPLEDALKSFRHLKTTFVDWNEVRVSSVREIQQALTHSPESLNLAVFVKELLEFVHRGKRSVSLEFLVEQNLGDIRRYLKQVRGLDSSTVSLILRLRKEHPVLPLSHAMEAVLERIGLFRQGETRDKREKTLHELVEPDRALAFHHFLLSHSQECCPPDEADVDCANCCMRRFCAFYASHSSRKRRNGSGKNSRSSGSARSSARAKAPARSKSSPGPRARKERSRGGSRR